MSASVVIADPLGAARGSDIRRLGEAAEFAAPGN
jgi:hypothetical protein